MAKLYIVGTPIGNLEDISMRALRTLREVSLIAAEDTRKARILLQHYAISTPLTSYFEGNEREKIPFILDALGQGDVAIISEAGMPGISDPGFPLIQAAIGGGYTITVIPGPSAHTSALVLSGLPTDRFMFIGFLPRKKSERLSALKELVSLRTPLICYEAPHRLHASLTDIRDIFGNRRVAMCRELTKLHEDIWRGDLDSALAFVETEKPRGEYTLVIEGAPEISSVWDETAVMASLQTYREQGLTHSQAARKVAQLSGWSRRDVYALHIEDKST